MTDDSISEEDSPWKWLTGGWARGVLVLTLLIIGFYVEEDLRGAKAWDETKAEVAAHGESLDAAPLIPPDVPDEKNFAALSLFQVAPDGYYPVELKNALSLVDQRIPSSAEMADQEKDSLPYVGSFRSGESFDLSSIQKKFAESCHRLLPSTQIPPSATPAGMFDLLCPVLSDLRVADANHPDCRIDVDYSVRPAYRIPLGGITYHIVLAKVMAYQERLSLLGNQPELAFADLKVEWKINSGLQKAPILVSGLVATAVTAIQLETVREGLVRHLWNDQQLAALDVDLGKIDFLADDQLCLRGEAVLFTIGEYDYWKNYRGAIRGALGFGSSSTPSTLEEQWDAFKFSCLFSLIPNGWFDQCKADRVRLFLTGAVPIVDPAARRVYPEKRARLQPAIDHAWFLGSGFGVEGMDAEFDVVKKFAYQQVQVDEARIACRLERYRLAHGAYPDSLQALVSAYGLILPQDIMNGKPYGYKLQADGNYLLYSVGWDQVDDGGKIGSLAFRNVSDPDWVWLNHPDPPKTK